MLSFFKPRPFFSPREQRELMNAIQRAEQRTSGEIRLFIESRCRYVDPLERAREIFYYLKMDSTSQRNAVLIYMAYKDRQLAVFGDEGIHIKAGTTFWEAEVEKLLSYFNKDNQLEGFITIIQEIGDSLGLHFPYDGDSDKNELPDEIVFGK